jgi:hypothetical protein
MGALGLAVRTEEGGGVVGLGGGRR